jgi:hypothetical protein
MNFNEFYLLSDKGIRDALYVLPKNNLEDYKLFRGELKLSLPLIFYQNIGKKAYDLIGSGYAGLDIFSNRILKTLTEHKISGWKSYPCEIRDRDNNIIEGYSIFSVTGRCGEIDYSKSKKIMIQPFSPQGKPVEGIRGLYFDPNSWDGMDIFTPNNTKLTFITEKVKNLFEKNRFTNIQFMRIIDFEH